MRREDGAGWGSGLTEAVYRGLPKNAALCNPVRMTPPTQPLPRLRLLGAVVAATTIAACALDGPGPSETYALLTPLLAACGGWLSWRLTTVARTELAALLYAGILLLPPLSLRGILTAVAFDDAAYVDVSTPVEGILVSTSQACGGLGPLLLAGGCAPLLLWGRRAAPGVGALLGAAAGAAAGRAGVHTALEALRMGDLSAAALWTAGFPFAGLFAAAGALLGWWSLDPTRRNGAVSVLTAGIGLAASIGTTPPLPLIEAGLPGGPATLPGAALPTGEPGLPMAREPRTAAEFSGLADGFAKADPPTWPCIARPENWHRRPRATAVVALAPDASTAVLDEAMEALSGVQVHRLALLGRSDTALPGPLADWLGWPAVSFLLDRPPSDARWAVLEADGLQWVDAPPAPGERANCAVLPRSTVTIQQAWDLGRGVLDGGIQARCGALAWVPPAWRPAEGTPDPRSLSCPGLGQ